METFFTRLAIVCKDFVTTCCMTSLTGKRALQKYTECYWSVKGIYNGFTHGGGVVLKQLNYHIYENSVQNTKIVCKI